MLGYHALHGELLNGDCNNTPYNQTVLDIWNALSLANSMSPLQAPDPRFDAALETILERGFDATTADSPLGELEIAKELMARFPDAPVLLSVHPGGPDGYAESVLYNVHGGANNSAEVNGTEWESTKATYIAENEEIKTFCQENNRTLLEFSVADGWEPLCAFLGVDVPDVPFPHVDAHGHPELSSGNCIPVSACAADPMLEGGLCESPDCCGHCGTA
jgi:hypothetical protein